MERSGKATFVLVSDPPGDTVCPFAEHEPRLAAGVVASRFRSDLQRRMLFVGKPYVGDRRKSGRD
jgi:hypothetical protein